MFPDESDEVEDSHGEALENEPTTFEATKLALEMQQFDPFEKFLPKAADPLPSESKSDESPLPDISLLVPLEPKKKIISIFQLFASRSQGSK